VSQAIPTIDGDKIEVSSEKHVEIASNDRVRFLKPTQGHDEVVRSKAGANPVMETVRTWTPSEKDRIDSGKEMSQQLRGFLESHPPVIQLGIWWKEGDVIGTRGMIPSILTQAALRSTPDGWAVEIDEGNKDVRNR
jgi:hypothetical protein